jgi:hypothetical protein
MHRSLFPVAILFLSLISASVYAGQATNQLGICLTDSLTGKERKNLAKWIFFSISAHPEINPYSNVSEEDEDKTNEFVGKLVTRLMADDCPNQTIEALEEDGSMAIESAFRLVGQVAMQELITNQDVAASISGFEKYLDQEKLRALTK